MTSSIWRSAHNSDHLEPAAFWIAMLMLAATGTALGLGGITPDVAWLIDMCERIYNGEKAYIDIFETTPPVPALLYMPGVLVEKTFGIDAGVAVHGLVAATYVYILYLTSKILPQKIKGLGAARWAIIAPAGVFLFALATDAFAQRETIAAVMTAPSLAVFIRYAEDSNWPSMRHRIMAALIGGLAVAIKPPLFAAPFLALGIWHVLSTWNIRGLYSSGLVATAAIAIAITAGSLAMFPAYLGDMTTLMRDIYVPARLPIGSAMTHAFAGIVACALAALVFYFRADTPRAVKLVGLIAMAYVVVYFVQAKFFSYHAAPAALFALIGAWSVIWPRLVAVTQMPKLTLQTAAPQSAVIVLSAIFLLVGCNYFRTGLDDRRFDMADMAWAENLNRPTAMAVSPDISTGFPLARRFDAVWVDRIHGQWVSLYTRIMLDYESTDAETKRLYQDYQARDIARTRSLIQEKRPEIIIYNRAPSAQWLGERLMEGAPDLFANYDVIAEQGAFRILRRRDAIETAQNDLAAR